MNPRLTFRGYPYHPGVSDIVGYDASLTLVQPWSLKRALAEIARDTINALDFGVVVGTDATRTTANTIALQAAINAAQASGKRLALPGGTIYCVGLLISGPVKMDGHGAGCTVLRAPSGAAAPVITVTVAGVTLPEGAAVSVNLDGFSITSPNRADASGIGKAHGIALANASVPVLTRVVLRDITIAGVPGDAIHAGSGFIGWVDSYGTDISLPGGNGIYANSVTDWRWFGGEVYGAVQDNILMTSVTALQFFGTNIYAAQGNNISAYGGSRSELIGCYVDISGKHGLLNQTTSIGLLKFSHCYFRSASQLTNNTYADIYCDVNSQGCVILTGCNFVSPLASIGALRPQFNIAFDASSTSTAVVDVATIFDAGSPAYGIPVTNDPTKIVGQTASGLGTAGADVSDLRANANTAYTDPVASSGGTVTMTVGQAKVMLLPAGTLATFSVVLPPNAVDGQTARISSSAAITALTVSAAGKTTLNGSTSLAAGQGVEFTYVLGGNTWLKSI